METNDISACERVVMKAIWDTPEEMALQQIMDKVNEANGKNWKPQTVSTFLSRLVKKGFLSSYRKGRYSFYQPVVSKEEFWKTTMKENAAFFTQNDMAAMACKLCTDMLSKQELETVKKKLAE